MKAEVSPALEDLRLSFVMGRGDLCKAAPTADWTEIEAGAEDSATFTHEDKLSESAEVCFAVKAVLGEETTYCDLKVSAESDGFADGYQPENALWVTLEDACGGCAPEQSCDGRKVMTQDRVCTVSNDTAVCAITGTLSEVKTCEDSEYCVSTASGADCAPCNCTPAIICDETDKTKGVQTLATCYALGICDQTDIRCTDQTVCVSDPAGIKTILGQCSASEATGCAYTDGTTDPCPAADPASCEGFVLKTPYATCSGTETLVCGTDIASRDCSEESKLCQNAECVAPVASAQFVVMPEHAYGPMGNNVWNLALDQVPFAFDLEIPGLTDLTDGIDALNSKMKVRIAYRYVGDADWTYVDVTGGSNIPASLEAGVSNDSDPESAAEPTRTDRYVAMIAPEKTMVANWWTPGEVKVRLELAFDGEHFETVGAPQSMVAANPCIRSSGPLCEEGRGDKCIDGHVLNRYTGVCEIKQGVAVCETEEHPCGGTGDEASLTCGTGWDGENKVFAEGSSCTEEIYSTSVDGNGESTPLTRAYCSHVFEPIMECPSSDRDNIDTSCKTGTDGQIIKLEYDGCIAGRCAEPREFFISDESLCLGGAIATSKTTCENGTLVDSIEFKDCTANNQACLGRSFYRKEDQREPHCAEPQIAWCQTNWGIEPQEISRSKDDKRAEFHALLVIPGLTGGDGAMKVDAKGNFLYPTDDAAVGYSHAVERMPHFKAQVVFGAANADLSKAAEANLVVAQVKPQIVFQMVDETVFSASLDLSEEDALVAGNEYAFAYRFSLDGGHTWTYCDTDSNEDDEAGYQQASQGKLTVTAEAEADCSACTAGAHCEGDLLFNQTGTCHIENGRPVCDITKEDCSAGVEPEYACEGTVLQWNSGYCDPGSKKCTRRTNREDCSTPAVTCSEDLDVATSTLRTCNAESGKCEETGTPEITVCSEGEQRCVQGGWGPMLLQTLPNSCKESTYGAGCQDQQKSCADMAAEIISCNTVDGVLKVTRYIDACDEDGIHCATETKTWEPSIECLDETHYNLYTPTCTDGAFGGYNVTRNLACGEGELCIKDACKKCERPEHCAEDATVTCEHKGSDSVCQKEEGSACIDGWYGDDCSNSCPNADDDIICRDSEHTVCNQDSGETESCTACDDGLYGDDCKSLCADTENNCDITEPGDITCVQIASGTVNIESCKACITGQYGTVCSETCANETEGKHCASAESTVCNQDSGETESCTACAQGYRGSDCSSPCANGEGQHCKTPEALACDRSTGEITNCSEGCAQGWYGADCKSPCENANKQYCAKPGKSQCDQTSGEIAVCSDDGCARGWYGADCKTQCENGEGQHCKNPEASVCARADGRITECSGGCEQGWYDFDCKSQCRNGEGQHCTSPETSACDQVSGEIETCDGGCEEGWFDANCKSSCISQLSGSAHCVTKDENGSIDYSKVTCDATSITCRECENGYFAPLCNQECTSGLTSPERCDRESSITCDSEGQNVVCEVCKQGKGPACQENCENEFSNVPTDDFQYVTQQITHCQDATKAACKDGPITSCGEPGCSAGWYGPRCDTQCQLSQENHCNTLTGTVTCISGTDISCSACLPGYYETCVSALSDEQHCITQNAAVTCETGDLGASSFFCAACEPGFGGVDCRKPCENQNGTHCATPEAALCKDSEDCEGDACPIIACAVSDRCVNDEWFGSDCSQFCAKTSIPTHCTEFGEAPKCARDGVITDCGSVDGIPVDCEDGYYGDDCNQECKDIEGIGETYHCRSWANVTCDKEGSSITSCGELGCEDCWSGEDCCISCKAMIDDENGPHYCQTGDEASVTCEETLVDGESTVEITACSTCIDGYYGSSCTESCTAVIIEAGDETSHHCSIGGMNDLITCNDSEGEVQITSCGRCEVGYKDDATEGPCSVPCANTVEASDGHPQTHCALPEDSFCGQTEPYITSCSVYPDNFESHCEDGWVGEDCSIPCKAPEENQHCVADEETDSGIIAHHYACISDTVTNWHCTACEKGYWGADCSKTCENTESTHCVHLGQITCDQETGAPIRCSDDSHFPNCSTGWHGKICDTACSNGSSHHCAHPETSLCDRGYIEICSGYNTPEGGCEDGWFGLSCMDTCSSQMEHCAKCTGYSSFMGVTNFECRQCAPGYWGENCDKTCCDIPEPTDATQSQLLAWEEQKKRCEDASKQLVHENCGSGSTGAAMCDRDTGIVGNDSGVSCTVCPEGRWDGTDNNGIDCDALCSNETGDTHCAYDRSNCDKKTGVITACANNACVDGYYGADCKSDCRVGAQANGYHCASDNLADFRCRQNGSNFILDACNGGCESEWAGSLCNRPCTNPRDLNCAEGATVCDQYGVIQSCTACADGWSGTDCSQKCRDLLHSLHPDNHCLSTAQPEEVTCNQDGSGLKCLSGCHNGWDGDACDEPLPLGNIQNCKRYQQGNPDRCEQCASNDYLSDWNGHECRACEQYPGCQNVVCEDIYGARCIE